MPDRQQARNQAIHIYYEENSKVDLIFIPRLGVFEDMILITVYFKFRNG